MERDSMLTALQGAGRQNLGVALMFVVHGSLFVFREKLCIDDLYQKSFLGKWCGRVEENRTNPHTKL